MNTASVPAAEQQAPADWLACPSCRALVYRKRFERADRVCPGCGTHTPLDAARRLDALLDPGSARPLTPTETVHDPLRFEDLKPYPDRLAAARVATGHDDAVRVALGTVVGHPVVLAVMDFAFMGGSLGVAAGEAVTTAADAALARRVPLILVTSSGGARMQEGALALMQMAKTSAAMAELDEAGILTVTVVADPTYGGVAASFATLADVVVCEPGARMGFAGPRVIEETIGERLPEGFQTAEFLLRHGLVDAVRPRGELRSTLAVLLASARGAGGAERVDGGDGAGVPDRGEAEERSGVSDRAEVFDGSDGSRGSGGSGGSGGVDACDRSDGTGTVTPSATLACRRIDAARGAQPTPMSAPPPVEPPVRPAHEVVAAARDLGRPTTRDHLAYWMDAFVELRGDRAGGDCPAIVGGLGLVDGRAMLVLGHQKGHTTADLVRANFAMASPAGYRKVVRLARLAEKLGVPLVTLIDTPGAHPGIEAEQQGQAGAIAACLRVLAGLRVPVVAVVTGEGGSGGALALGVADRVLISANALYSVISPEGCAAILWKTREQSPAAARALGLDARSLLELGVVDRVVPEPEGGAHTDPAAASLALRDEVLETVAELAAVEPAERVVLRRRRFRAFGLPAVRSAGAGDPDDGDTYDFEEESA
ncbi:acetyl-CoA carboxylase, carboxyltransferase subunit beta (plasmid) [Embleya sp. NBC_00888]|uniref:acetyl-CoA carboxylase, carboxyltransferase subunit beta n=1 Tax=Embleya sp. NBC_00888 TaxID=2975960 RepID=UPI002F9148FB|nr:acetyl-CoA carboxylase, carboxyltransferase subunit beta [Embleya sp. NBC_00888]